MLYSFAEDQELPLEELLIPREQMKHSDVSHTVDQNDNTHCQNDAQWSENQVMCIPSTLGALYTYPQVDLLSCCTYFCSQHTH